MMAHHVLTIFAYAMVLTTGRCHFFACYLGLCEVSNLFLDLNTLFRLSDSSPSSPSSPQLLRLVNLAVLITSYALFRIALFSFWYYMFYSEMVPEAMMALTWLEHL